MSSNALVLTPINGEPRVKDLHLASRLEFSDPYMIRKLIKRNEYKLLKFGIVSTVETIHQGAGRPTSEFYLNQKQAIFICMKSETEKAFDVQVEIVHAFDAYLNGELKPALPRSYADALRLYADQVERNEQQQREIEASRPKIAFHDQVVVSETLIDFAELFSLLQRKTGQSFTRSTFLAFGRRNGFICQPNPHSGITKNRLVPRRDYIGTWFVSEMHGDGGTEWKVRPLAIAGMVSLIELERNRSPLTGQLGQEAA